MTKKSDNTDYRIIPVKKGKVECLVDKNEDLERCRFCVFSRFFRIKGEDIKAPALAFCPRHGNADCVDLSKVESVICGDRKGEGFMSILNVIS